MSDRAAFLDRDGVINRKAPGNGYVTCWEEMHFLPGTAEAIALFNQAGFRVIIVSNQRCIAKGLVTPQAMNAMHRKMCHWFAEAGAIIDDVYYCPHAKRIACNCRKPAPGLLLTAAREHKLDLKKSWMIGDSDIDIEAGKNAGCKTARLLHEQEIATGSPDVIDNSLLAATHQIIQRETLTIPLGRDDAEANITGRVRG